MKVVITTREPIPNGMAGTKRILCYAKALSIEGTKVTILNTNRTERAGLINNPNNQGQINDYVNYMYAGGTSICSKNIFVRQLSYIKDHLCGFVWCLKNLDKNTVVISYGNSIRKQFLDILSAKLKGAKVCRELCEYPYKDDYSKSFSLLGLKQWIMLHCTFKGFDGFLTISHTLKELCDRHKKNSAKQLLIPILVDSTKREIESINIEHPYIFHSGTLYENKDGFLGLIRAFAKAHSKCPDLHFYSTGYLEKAPETRTIKEIIEEFNLNSFIHFLGYLNEGELQKYQNGASMFIINKYDSFQNRSCVSTKLGEYLLCKKSVIITNIG